MCFLNHENWPDICPPVCPPVCPRSSVVFHAMESKTCRSWRRTPTRSACVTQTVIRPCRSWRGFEDFWSTSLWNTYRRRICCPLWPLKRAWLPLGCGHKPWLSPGQTTTCRSKGCCTSHSCLTQSYSFLFFLMKIPSLYDHVFLNH